MAAQSLPCFLSNSKNNAFSSLFHYCCDIFFFILSSPLSSSPSSSSSSSYLDAFWVAPVDSILDVILLLAEFDDEGFKNMCLNLLSIYLAWSFSDYWSSSLTLRVTSPKMFFCFCSSFTSCFWRLFLTLASSSKYLEVKLLTCPTTDYFLAKVLKFNPLPNCKGVDVLEVLTLSLLLGELEPE